MVDRPGWSVAYRNDVHRSPGHSQILGRCLTPYQAPLAADAQQKPGRATDGTTLRQPEPLLWREVLWLNDCIRSFRPLVQVLQFDPADRAVEIWCAWFNRRFDGDRMEWLE